MGKRLGNQSVPTKELQEFTEMKKDLQGCLDQLTGRELCLFLEMRESAEQHQT